MSLYRNFGTVVAFVFLVSVDVVSAQSGGPPQCPAGDPRSSTPQPSESGDAPDPEDAAGFTESSNLLGQTDTGAAESRRNENVQFNLVDNNALKELRVRLGTTATIIEEFKPAGGYFGAEFGASPKGPLHMVGSGGSGLHGSLYELHQNSVFTARSFFQVGDVQPARENDYGFNVGAPGWAGSHWSIDASRQKLRGVVNGNVLVPKPDERTPLTPRSVPSSNDTLPRTQRSCPTAPISTSARSIRMRRSGSTTTICRLASTSFSAAVTVSIFSTLSPRSRWTPFNLLPARTRTPILNRTKRR